MHPSTSRPPARRRFRWTYALGALALLAGTAACSPTQVLNGLSVSDGQTISNSLAYGAGERRTLDVYSPQNARNAPVVVFFYGGSWQGGNKEMYQFVASSLTARGFVVMVPDYTVYPQTRFPGFVQDGARAFAWAKRNATRFGGNPNRVFLMGHSAGSHIAAMLAFDGQWLQAAGLSARRDVAGFVGLAGPYDFLPIEDPKIKEVFAGGDIRRTQPINFVSGGEPPSFIGYATSDSLVEPGNSTRMAARLRARGNVVVERAYSGANHLTLIGAFAAPLRFVAPVRDDVADFIDRVAGGRSVAFRDAAR